MRSFKMYQSSVSANHQTKGGILSRRRGLLLSVCVTCLLSMTVMPAWSVAEEPLKSGGVENSATLPLPPTIDAGISESALGQSGGVAIKPPEAADPMAGVSEASDALDALAWPEQPKSDQPKEDKSAPPPTGVTGAAAVVPATAAEPPAEMPPTQTPSSSQPVAAQTDPVAVTPVTGAEQPSTVSETKADAPVQKSEESLSLSSDVSSLEKRLTALEKRLEVLETKAVETSKAVTPAEVSAVEKAPQPPVKKKKKIAPRKRWVLKSAKPGEAWVAEAGSSEMQVISVGQVLNGVGRVTAIEQDDAGRWVVTGTRGKIAQ